MYTKHALESGKNETKKKKKLKKIVQDTIDTLSCTCYNVGTTKRKGHNTMTYGYARCSTNEDKQDVNRQRRELVAAGADEVYTEYQHGTAAVKPELEKLFEKLQAGDTLIVTEVSRLSRSTQQLCGIIERVQALNIRLEVLKSIVIDCRSGELDPMTKAFVQMSGVFAELERNMISERVKSGMENAKAKGSKVGRPKATIESIPRKFLEIYPRIRNGQISKMEAHKITGLSRVSIDKYIQLLEEQA